MSYDDKTYKEVMEQRNPWAEVITVPQHIKDLGKCRCKYCNSIVEKTRMAWMNANAKGCSFCSDGISYPNKFIRTFISQLPIESYCYEYSAEWTKTKKYDVFFICDNLEYVVEMDGIQHFRDSEWSLFETQNKNDLEKDKLARDNNVTMIRIDARLSELDYIKNNILNSKFANLFDLTEIDWIKCHKNAVSSLVVEVSKYYEENNHPLTSEVSEHFHIPGNRILSYLKQGTELGICNYSKSEMFSKSIEKSLETKKERSPIFSVYDENDNFISEYKSTSDCVEELHKLYPDINIDPSYIRVLLKGHGKYHGLKFIYNDTSWLSEDKEKLLKDVCSFFNKHPDMTNKEIADKFNIKNKTLVNYLNTGTQLGLCNYDPIKKYKQGGKKGSQGHRLNVTVYDNDKLIGTFLGYKEVSDVLNKKYPNLKITFSSFSTAVKRAKSDSFMYKGLKVSIDRKE